MSKMTMRYVHPAEEQKKEAAARVKAFRTEGILDAILETAKKVQPVTTISTAVN